MVSASRNADWESLSFFFTTLMATRLHRTMLRSGSVNKSDFARELFDAGLKQSNRRIETTMADLTNETEYQKDIRRGRPLETLTPAERLDWANHQTTKPREPVQAAPLSYAQSDYLGTRSVADLTDPLDIENFHALGGEAFKRPPPEPKLDPTKLDGKPPEFRLATAEAYDTVQRAKASPGSVDQRRLDAAIERVAPYLS